MLMFNYKKSSDQVFNDLVETMAELGSDFTAGNGNTAEYAEKNATFNESFAKYCVEKSGDEFTGLDMLKDPNYVNNNNAFYRAFSTVLAQAITPTVPQLVSNNYGQLFDVHQCGWGDNAEFTVESNEYFTVYNLAEGINMGTQQTAYNNTYTITAQKRSISVQVDWYHVAAGLQNWGNFATKVAKSFQAYIFASAIKAMTKALTQTSTLGIAGYTGLGFTDDNWVTVAQNVSLANGGADTYALGTLRAISKVLPSDGAFRYGPNDDVTKVGYLPAYKNVPIVRLDQALVPGSINTATPTSLVNDNLIFFIAMGGFKPIHVVFEGNNVAIDLNPMETKDCTYGLTISMYLGVDTVVGSKFGTLTI